MEVLNRYSDSSGQVINTAKSAFYIDDAYLNRETLIYQITRMTRGSMSFIYLGVPVSSGCINATHFDHILDKVRRTVDGCKSKILSFEGRLTIIKAVLSSYYIYTMACTLIHVTVLRSIESNLANFLWNIRGSSRIHWVSWERICLPCDEGGLGVGYIRDKMAALQAKLLWNVMENNSLWANFARRKYFFGEDPGDKTSASPFRRALMRHFEALQTQSQWIVGEGTRWFWSDNWADEIIGWPRPIDEHLSISAGVNIIDDLWEYIPHHLHTRIHQTTFDPS